MKILSSIFAGVLLKIYETDVQLHNYAVFQSS